MMKDLLIILFLLLIGVLNAQSCIGSINSSSSSLKNSFVAGDIHIEGNSGVLGVTTFLYNKRIAVEDIYKSDDFELFPNPTSFSFTIRSKQGNKIKEIRMIDANGKLISNINVNTRNDISLLKSGVYFLIINHIKAIKLIKL